MRMPTISGVIGRMFLTLPLILACGGDSLGPPLVEPSTLYWDLNLNHHAVTLSTTSPSHDTLTLIAMPRNISQEPLPGLPAPIYVSEDPERVLVTSEGMLVAVAPMAPGTQVKVVASLTAGNAKHTDYALVRVVDNPTPPMLASLSVQPLRPDSAKLAAVRVMEREHDYRLPMRATDTAGGPLVDLLVSVRSSDSRVAAIDEITRVVQGFMPGWVNFYAAATAFGVTKADTLRFRIGLPITSRFVLLARSDGIPGNFLEERELRVGVGAMVYWQATGGDASTDADITFADPTHVAALPTSPLYAHPVSPLWLCDAFESAIPGVTDCAGSGSFVLRPILVPNSSSPFWILGIGARTFPVAGIYPFRSTLQGFDGKIVVVDESDSP